jgi:hypothetical protein
MLLFLLLLPARTAATYSPTCAVPCTLF